MHEIVSGDTRDGAKKTTYSGIESATKRMAKVMSRGMAVNGLEMDIPRGDVGGGSWNWYWWGRVVDLEERDLIRVRIAGILVSVTIGDVLAKYRWLVE
jgi:hypothetical protein